MIPFFWESDLGTPVVSSQVPGFAEVTTPFPIKVYDRESSRLFISQKGMVDIDPDNPARVFGPPGSLPSGARYAIIPNWSDFRVFGGAHGNVFFNGTPRGSSPNRYISVTWDNVKFHPADPGFYFQLLLYENGTFQFNYQSLANGIAGIDKGDRINFVQIPTPIPANTSYLVSFKHDTFSWDPGDGSPARTSPFEVISTPLSCPSASS
jgi:hypothetical protein